MPDKSVLSPPYAQQHEDLLGPLSGTTEFWPGWPVLFAIDPDEREVSADAPAELPTARPEIFRQLRASLEKALHGYGSLTRQQGTVRVRRGAAEEFKTGFKKDRRRALDRLLFKVSLRELSKREAVELLLPVLADAPSRQLNAVFDAIMALNDPSSILDVALSEYNRTGRQRFLSLAVSLLEQSGAAAWPALLKLARSTRPECELFIDTIARCEGVALEQRRKALGALRRHPDSDVRSRAGDALAELNPGNQPDAPLVLVPGSPKAS